MRRFGPGCSSTSASCSPRAKQKSSWPSRFRPCCLRAPYGNSVFIVEDKKDEKTGAAGLRRSSDQQFVRLGVARGDYVDEVSRDGVKVGDVVVSTGAFKLHNGTTVSIDNSLAPVLKTAPTPVDS